MHIFKGRFFDGITFQEGSVYIKNGFIHEVKLGTSDSESDSDLEEYKTIILKNNEVLVPGFIDSHGHLGTALANNILNMTPLHPEPAGTVSTLASLVDTLVNAYIGTGPVLGVDYDDSFIGCHPTYSNMLEDGKTSALQAVEDKTKQKDIIIIHNSGHLAVVSRNLLDSYYGILREDGTVIKDWSETDSELANSFSLDLVEVDENGFPTGLMKEDAWLAITPYFATLMENESANLLDKFAVLQNKIFSMGVTSVQDAACNSTNSTIFSTIDNLDMLQMSIYNVYDVQHVNDQDENDIKIKLSSNIYNPLIHESGAKLFFDGSPQGQTAAVMLPYLNDKENYGVLNFAKEDEDQLSKKISEYIYNVRTSVNVHCNGDKAIDQLLRLCDDVLLLNNGAPFPAPVVIVHCQLMSDENRNRLLELRRKGADVRPTFFVNHLYFFSAYEETLLGPERISDMSPCAWASDHKIPFTIHSDCPVTALWPKYLISNACNRTDRNGKVHGSKHAISVSTALRSLTQYAADQVGVDRIGGYGRICEGYRADIVVLGNMPKEYTPPPLHNLTVKTFGTDEDGHFTVKRVFKHGVEVELNGKDAKDHNTRVIDIKFKYTRCNC